MTCVGCGREVTLLDGRFCGLCGSAISAAINTALKDVSVVEAQVHDVTASIKDGLLHVRLEYEGAHEPVEVTTRADE